MTLFMPLLLGASLAMAPASAQTADRATYQDDQLGLSFSYPNAWTLRRDRTNNTLEIPLAGGGIAEVQIFNSQWRGSTEEWMNLQAEFARSSQREVVRQWQEVILGVPMLMSKTAFNVGDVPSVAVAGLLYARVDNKLSFRLVAPASGADEAEAGWREALMTLRTNSGELPQAEQPGRVDTAPPPQAPTAAQTAVHVWAQPDTAANAYRGPVVVPVTVQETAVNVYLPDGWALETAEGKTLLRHPAVPGSVELSVAFGDVAAARARLLAAARESLADFQSVRLREEPAARYSRSGSFVATVWRDGQAASGPLAVVDAVGITTGLFWTARYRAAGGGAMKSARDAQIDTLLDVLFVQRPS